jgi:hypothetical protein
MKRIVFAAVLLFATSSGLAQDAKAPAEAVARPALDNIGDYVAVRGCKTDADCKDPVPDDCKGYKCLPYKSEVNPVTGEVTTVGKCSEYEIPNCLPPPVQDCNELHKGDPYAIKCCGAGFSQAADPVAFKCCSEHVSHGEDPGTPANPVPCGEDCPQCPDCRQPEIDCEKIVGNEELKKCCTAKEGKLWFVLDACIPDGPGSSGDCNIVINAGGDFINNGQMNICCQVVNNSGTITDTTISQACENTGGGPGGGTTGGTPTTPSGSAPALGTCTVTPATSDVIDGKEFAFGKDWIVSYSAPSGIGPVASVRLTKVEGVEITAEEAADPAGGWMKTISDPASLPPFNVHTPKPPEMVTKEKEQPQFKVRVQLRDLAGGELASMECDNAGFFEAMGSGGCGCDMTGRMNGREQILAYAVMAALLGLPLMMGKVFRARIKKSRSVS